MIELHLGDGIAGMATLPDRSVGVTITDPPFDAHTHSRGGNVVRHDGGPAIAKIPFAALSDVRPVAEQIARVTRRWALVFCAVRQIEQWATAFESAGWNVPRVMAWFKPDASPQFSGDRPGHGFESIITAHAPGRTRWNGGGMKGVYDCNRIDHESGFLHPTQKPLRLIEALVKDFTDPGELICDPFAGSGTTLVACKRLGRNAIGWEKDPKFHAAAVKRIDAAREQMGLALVRPRKAKQAALALADPEVSDGR